MDFLQNIKTFVVALIGQWFLRGWQEGWIRFTAPMQAGWPDELKMLFTNLSRNMLMHSEEMQFAIETAPEISFTDFWNHMIILANEEGDICAQRWVDLDEKLGLTPEEISMLAVLTAIHLYWPTLRALRFAMSEQSPGQPRWGFMVEFLAEGLQSEEVSSILYPSNSILFTSSIVQFRHSHEPNLAASELLIPQHVIHYLTNAENYSKDSLPAISTKELPNDLKTQIKRVPTKLATHIAITGVSGSEKLVAAQAMAHRLKRSGITVADLSPDVQLADAIQHVIVARACAPLKNHALVLNHAAKWFNRWNEGILRLIDTLKESVCPIIWIMTGDIPDAMQIPPECIIRLPLPNAQQRAHIWQELIGDQLSTTWIQQLAGQFLLSQGQITECIRIALATAPVGEENLYKALAGAARSLSKEGLGSLATPEPARVSMDQLIVSQDCMTALQDLLMYAKHRHELAKEWGFERSMPYGLGLAALFSGPPGTGNTYGAQVIATELQLELYRVDLSQLVSKYIGETEKHLAELFNAAEQGQILLLFDEADSIFGKRTEVKTSVDRYANLEINFLLQRLERFSGVSILTSNFESGIDEAFMRRIRFKVPFDLPEKNSRQILWEKFLSPSIPRAKDVDTEDLAELFELSGGHIKEAVLRAASIAYGSPEKCVTQDLLMVSAELEYKKLGKLLPYRKGDTGFW